MAKKIDYSVEVECCEEIVLSAPLSKKLYDFEIRRLTLQCDEPEVCDTKTELTDHEAYETPMRYVEHTTFLRGTTFITFTKTEWKVFKYD